MTTYTSIPTADIDTDSPITTTLMTLMRDNPIAITEGATGAPRVQRSAFDSKVLLKWLYDFGDGSDGAQAWTTAGSPYSTGLRQCTTFSIAAGQTATLSPRGTLIIMAKTSITITGTLNHDGGGGEGGFYNDASVSGVFMGGNGGAGMYGGSGGGSGATGLYGGDGGDVLYARGGAGTVGGAGTAGSAQPSIVQNTLKLLTPGVLNAGNRWGAGAQMGRQGQSSTGGGGGGGFCQAGVGFGTWKGGDGGGLIILIAPVITLQAGSFIYSRGTAGVSYGGGGGGGCVIAATPAGGYSSAGTITTTGGAGSGGVGQAGGAGWSANFTI